MTDRQDMMDRHDGTDGPDPTDGHHAAGGHAPAHEIAGDEFERRAGAAAALLPLPGRALEERTVAALHERGLLRGGRRATSPRALSGGWLAAGVAAALACFLGGVSIGQGMGARQTADAVAQVRSADAQQAAAAVQQAGSAYIAALTALGLAADQGDAAALATGREVALNAFHAAADELLRIAPDDPLAALIQQAGETATRRQAPPRSTQRRVVWF